MTNAAGNLPNDFTEFGQINPGLERFLIEIKRFPPFERKFRLPI